MSSNSSPLPIVLLLLAPAAWFAFLTLSPPPILLLVPAIIVEEAALPARASPVSAALAFRLAAADVLEPPGAVDAVDAGLMAVGATPVVIS